MTNSSLEIEETQTKVDPALKHLFIKGSETND